MNTIVNRCQLYLKNWVTVHQDRAATNKARLCEICDEFHEASATQNYCCSRGLSNTGKQALGVDGAVRYAEMFRKQWQKMLKPLRRQGTEQKKYLVRHLKQHMVLGVL